MQESRRCVQLAWCICWAVGAWSSAEKGVSVCSGSEGAANTVTVGARIPWAGGSEGRIIAGRGGSREK